MTKNKIPGAQLLASISTVKSDIERPIQPYDHKKSKIQFSDKFNEISEEVEEIIKYHLAERQGLKIKLVVYDLIVEGDESKEELSVNISVNMQEKMEAFVENNFFLDPKMQMVDTIGFIKLDHCEQFAISIDSIFKIDSLQEPISVVLSIDDPDADTFQMKILKICSDIDPKSPQGLIGYKNCQVILDWEDIEHVDKIFISLYSIGLGEDVALSQIGLSILPIRFDDNNLIMNGVFQIPIFNELLDQENGRMMSQTDVWSLLAALTDTTNKENLTAMMETTLIVRMHPVFISCMYPEKNDTSLVNTSMLPVGFPGNQLFNNSNKIQEMNSGNNISEIIPKDFDVDEIDENLVRFYQICNGEELTVEDDGVPLENPFKSQNGDGGQNVNNNGFNKDILKGSDKGDVDHEESHENDDFEDHTEEDDDDDD